MRISNRKGTGDGGLGTAGREHRGTADSARPFVNETNVCVLPHEGTRLEAGRGWGDLGARSNPTGTKFAGCRDTTAFRSLCRASSRTRSYRAQARQGGGIDAAEEISDHLALATRMAVKLLSLLLPGLWHVLNDRCGAGLTIFAAWAVSLNGFLIWPLAMGQDGTGWRYTLLVVAAGVWVFSAATAFCKGAPPTAPPKAS